MSKNFFTYHPVSLHVRFLKKARFAETLQAVLPSLMLKVLSLDIVCAWFNLRNIRSLTDSTLGVTDSTLGVTDPSPLLPPRFQLVLTPSLLHTCACHMPKGVRKKEKRRKCLKSFSLFCSRQPVGGFASKRSVLKAGSIQAQKVDSFRQVCAHFSPHNSWAGAMKGFTVELDGLVS